MGGERVTSAAISDYGFLSDCQGAALVHRDGAIDWYCPGRFDAPAVFARLLDPNGGHWSIRPCEIQRIERRYLDDTLVIQTVFYTPQGAVALTDALALEFGARGHAIGRRSPHLLLRRLEGLSGEVEVAIEWAPRLEYGLTVPCLIATEHGVATHSGPIDLVLQSDCPLQIDGGTATTHVWVRPGETINFALFARDPYRDTPQHAYHIDVGAALDDTCAAWRSWADLHRGYQGPYCKQVRQSALVLQGLTYQPSGAIVAAPTTSLPEITGGVANWDYRFAWLRDLSLALRALWIAACPDEVHRYFGWIDRALGHVAGTHQPVQIMYGVAGERDLTEHTLDHLRGFHDSRPVRVGNDAWFQKQLDVLGEVVDAVYLFRDSLADFDGTISRLVAGLADQAATRWHEPDAGMWEARDRERHYVSSKVMCWVALDRAVKLAARIGAEDRVENWTAARDAARQTILARGWSERAGAYTGAFDSDHLDASVLLMPLVDFLPASDPRMRATIDAIARELTHDGLVHRWDGDPNGFLLCTYWLVECLARIGEIERARSLFERTTAYANDLGLLAEMVDATTHTLLGNFPQAFSHIGLINAAWCIEQAERNQR